MENLESKFMKPQISDEETESREIPQVAQEGKSTIDYETKQTEATQKKIVDEQKIEYVRGRLGSENREEKIRSFIGELPTREGHIDFSQLKRIGHGGTHDVFIYPHNSQFVIKLNRGALEKAMSIGQENLPPDIRQMADRYVASENGKNEQLYEFFGQDHCLRETVMVGKISVEKDGAPQNFEGIISIQEASDVFKDPNRKDFSTGYTEQGSELGKNKEIYDRMNKALLGKEEFDEKDFLEFNDKLKSIFELIAGNKEFADCMREFLLRFKNYFESSGRFIDLVGQENVLFYEEEGKWTFKLGSVVKGENIEVMAEAMKALEENPERVNQDERLKNQLMNQLALIRLLNATGLKVGIGKIVNVQLSEKQIENLDKIKFKKEVDMAEERNHSI